MHLGGDSQTPERLAFKQAAQMSQVQLPALHQHDKLSRTLAKRWQNEKTASKMLGKALLDTEFFSLHQGRFLLRPWEQTASHQVAVACRLHLWRGLFAIHFASLVGHGLIFLLTSALRTCLSSFNDAVEAIEEAIHHDHHFRIPASSTERREALDVLSATQRAA